MSLRREEYQRYLLEEEQRELAANTDLIDGFKAWCLSKGVVIDDEDFRYVRTIGIVAVREGIVNSLYPDLLIDKDGLMDFRQLIQSFKLPMFVGGTFQDANCMLLAHPHFRRGYHSENNFAPSFLDVFWRLKHDHIDPMIALDMNRVRVDVNGGTYMERDMWYGAKFTQDIASIPDILVKLRPPLDLDPFDIDHIFGHIHSLDVKWSSKDRIKTFQAEEFKTEEVVLRIDGEDYFPAKYIHAEFDMDNGYFRHFDGAIHLYTLDEYCDRIESDLDYNEKHNVQIKAASDKLFRIDGNITTAMWMELSSHFFTGDPLIFEYYEGALPQRILDIIEAIRKHRGK